MSRIKAGGGHLPGAPGRNRGERAEEQRGAGGLGGRQEGCSIEQGAHAAEGSKEEEARAGRRAARGTQYPVLVQYRYTCTAHYSPETMMMIDLGMVPVSNVSKLMEAPMVTAQQAQQAQRAGSARRGAAQRARQSAAGPCRALPPTGGGAARWGGRAAVQARHGRASSHCCSQHWTLPPRAWLSPGCSSNHGPQLNSLANSLTKEHGLHDPDPHQAHPALDCGERCGGGQAQCAEKRRPRVAQHPAH